MHVYLLFRREYQPIRDSEWHIGGLDVYSTMELANAAGKVEFENIWADYKAQYGNARTKIFLANTTGECYVARNRARPGQPSPNL